MNYIFYIILGIVGLFVLVLCYMVFKMYFMLKKPDDINTERRMTDMMMGLEKSSYKNTLDINSQINNVAKETSELKEFLRQTNLKMKELSRFQDLFKTPKLRGE
ncbi:MAG: hypothetical protein PHO23_02080 [Candidatus Pacebacteria bacterium]|nr:hypothetical protein [Candidatus Paceibacterota bacterium]